MPVIRRAASTLTIGLVVLAAVTFLSLWIGFDSATTAFLFLIVIALLSLGGGFLPAFLLTIFAVAALHLFFVSPDRFPGTLGVLDVVELTAFLVVAGVTTRLVSRATQVAREAEARARLLDLTHDAVVALDAEGRIKYWNRGAENLYAWTAAEAIGRLGADLLQAGFPGPSDESSRLAETGVWHGESIHTTRDGRRVIVDARIVMERDASGGPLGLLATTTDITERKMAEDNLRKAQEALTHVTRLTTLGEVSASVAHEINQPLAAIVNNANASLVLLDDLQPNLGELRVAMKEVVEDAQRASGIIERIRQMSRRSVPEHAPCLIHEIVDDVLNLAARSSAARGVAIDTEIPQDLPPVLGDRVQLEQVLLNLVMNAIEAMSDVEPLERRMEICATVDTEDGHTSVTMRVADRGVGLKPEDMPRLFEAFHTTKPHGIGLGLAISRSIIEAHRGRLWAERNGDKGAVFAFRLPAALAEAAT
jgi:PAS domain S-box-containing protein